MVEAALSVEEVLGLVEKVEQWSFHSVDNGKDESRVHYQLSGEVGDANGLVAFLSYHFKRGDTYMGSGTPENEIYSIRVEYNNLALPKSHSAHKQDPSFLRFKSLYEKTLEQLQQKGLQASRQALAK